MHRPRTPPNRSRAAPRRRCPWAALALAQGALAWALLAQGPAAAQALPPVPPASAPPSPLDPSLGERVLTVPVDDEGLVRLQVTWFQPPGPGPFPMAVLNHGKDPGLPSAAPRYRSVYAARYFLSRGYAVALPMMRGYAGSGGATWTRGCDAEREARLQARDIARVVQHLAAQSEVASRVDARRVVVSGQSLGGWNTLALGPLSVPGVKALVNFAGGRRAPACPLWEVDLVHAAGRLGEHSRLPSLWFYGDNDAQFPQALWHGLHEAYTASGAPAELVAYGTFQKDSHGFLGQLEALPLWTPRLDAFLQRVGLPGQLLHRGFLPEPYPDASGFADLGDLSALPRLGEKGRASYRHFLTQGLPRVFAIADHGATLSVVGGHDPLARARQACVARQWVCKVYAIDDRVVWTPD